eukprot:610042-Rhodomonas_salina.1
MCVTELAYGAAPGKDIAARQVRLYPKSKPKEPKSQANRRFLSEAVACSVHLYQKFRSFLSDFATE